MREKYAFVGDVRGRGLFLAIELVKDRKSKEGMSKAATNRVFGECMKRGLLTMSYASSFRIQPSMTIDAGTVDEAVGILYDVFDIVEKEGFWKV
jgi:4-aminobutyrate aminotransferase-like enzyme